MARRVGFGDTDRSRLDARETRLGDGARAARLRGYSRIFLLFILLFPAVFGGIGGYMLIDAIRFRGVAKEAVGVVVKVERHSGTDGTSYTAIFRYADEDGRTHTAPTHVSSSEYDYRRGATEEILYDPAAPDDEVRVNGVFSLWGLPVIFFTLGLVFLYGFSRAYRTHRRNLAKA